MGYSGAISIERIAFPMKLKMHMAALPLILVGLLAACAPPAEVQVSVEAAAPMPAAAPARDLAMAAPEEVGMDSARLDRLTGAMQGLVDEGRLAGVVTAVARHGKIVHFESAGYRDMEAGAAMTNDALFRIYSMTKPITGVALMMLYEEGKFRLSDPVERYIPELGDLQVAAGTDDNGEMITEPATHPMTIRELMAHTGGLTYGIFSASGVDAMYVEADLLNNDNHAQGDGNAARRDTPAAAARHDVALQRGGGCPGLSRRSAFRHGF